MANLHTVAPTPAEEAAIQAWKSSDYWDLIPLEYVLPMAQLSVAAARRVVAEEIAQAIEDARGRAKAYHYRAALSKAAALARAAGDDPEPTPVY